MPCHQFWAMELTTEQILAAGFAESTNKNRASIVANFQQFCTTHNAPFLPTDIKTLASYVTFLANRKIKASSIRNYLAAIGTHHKLNHLDNPGEGSFYLKTMLKGVKRLQAYMPNSKHPLTTRELLLIYNTLNWSQSIDRTFWACLIIGFWTFLRGGNLVPNATNKFDPGKHVSGKSLIFVNNHVMIGLRRTKTIQFNERQLLLPLVPVANSPFCPIWALAQMWELCPLQDQGSLFAFNDTSGVKQLLHAKLNERTYQAIHAVKLL